MNIRPTPLAGVFEIGIAPHADARGFFARTWCRETFARAGIDVDLVQGSLSHNARAGTLRGMHFTWPPSREGKLIRCQQGAVHDVLLDLRPDSPSFLQHVAVELSAARHNALWAPPGIAHGFLTLADDTVVAYLMSTAYEPDLQGGVRFDDAAFGIAWPRPVALIHERDRTYPDFDRAAHVARWRSVTVADAAAAAAAIPASAGQLA